MWYSAKLQALMNTLSEPRCLIITYLDLRVSGADEPLLLPLCYCY